MLYSMTGFGQGESSVASLGVRVLVRTVNHRGLDLRLNLPSEAAPLEAELTRRCRSQLGRGRVELRAEVFHDSGAGAVNREALRSAFLDLEEARVELGIVSPVTIADLVRAPGVWGAPTGHSAQELKEPLMAALDEALVRLNASRLREGEELRGELERLLGALQEQLECLRKRAPARIEEYQTRIEARVRELIEEHGEIAQDRLLMEVGILADKADINEEIGRLSAHFQEVGRLLGQGREANAPVGKKIDFFLQEINREVNTVASKSRDLELTSSAIEMKSILESLREQCANIQ